MNRRLKSSIKQSFTAPPPKQREAFLKNLNQPKAKPYEVFLTQASYIKKTYWLCAGMIIVLVNLWIQNTGLKEESIFMISALLPLFSLLSITEIHKSIAHNMAEMELGCKYNLGQITLMRMAVIGSLSTVLLVMLVFISRDIGFGILKNTLLITLPFLMANYLSIWIINHLRIKEVIYVCSGVTVCISMLPIVLSNMSNNHLIMDATILWGIGVLLMLVLLGMEVRKLIGRMGELTWS